jgi:RNA polymerase sigma-70 factor (ECF subfamily)
MGPAATAQASIAAVTAVHQTLVDRYARQAVRFAYHILGSSEDAEDVAQEALIRALYARARFRQEAAFSTWLYRVVHNLCIDRLRAKQRAGLVPLEDHAHTLVSSDSRQAFDRVLDLQALVQALRSLPPALRSIVLLRDVEGLSYRELAAVFRIPVGTVKSRLNHARRLLRCALEAQQ